MADVVFSSFAESDLDDIFSYVAEFNVDSAKKTVKNLMQKFKLLAGNPKIGRSHDELILNLRSFPYKKLPDFLFPD